MRFPRYAKGLALAGLVVLLPSLGGCSGWWWNSRFEEPDVQLVKVEVIKARLLEQEFLLTFKVDNPNDRELPIRGFNYDIHLNDIPLASGESNTRVDIPAHGRRTFDVPAHTNLWRHLKYIVKLLEEPNEPVHYRLRGEIKTGLLLGQRVHLSRNGEIIPGNFLPE